MTTCKEASDELSVCIILMEVLHESKDRVRIETKLTVRVLTAHAERATDRSNNRCIIVCSSVRLGCF